MKSPKLFLISTAVLLGTAGVASARPVAPPAFTLRVFAGAPNKASYGPDDITALNGHIFVGWQNGVGTMGEPSKTGNTNSLVVEYSHRGKVLGKWSVKGKVDGIGGDPNINRVIASVNEDGNTSLYTIRPGGSTAIHYTYSPSPDAKGKSAVMTGGGTDSVIVDGSKILIAASNPTRSGRTATFWVTLGKGGVAKLHPTFSDDANAIDGVTGNPVKLHVTDPDSNGVVPGDAGLYGGDYVLDGQADQELIFASGIGGHASLTRLQLSWDPTGAPAGVDDIRWAKFATDTLYVVDNGANKIYSVTGPFGVGDVVASMDSIGTKSFGGDVAELNPGDGTLDPFITGLKASKGLLFMP
jgi:hypothetical protein